MDLPPQLREAGPSGLVLVPKELPEELFVSAAGVLPTEGEASTFIMDVNRRLQGVYTVCVAQVVDRYSCPMDPELENVRTGTVGDVRWRVSSGYTDVAWEPEMTPDWETLDWVAQNEDRPGRG